MYGIAASWTTTNGTQTSEYRSAYQGTFNVFFCIFAIACHFYSNNANELADRCACDIDYSERQEQFFHTFYKVRRLDKIWRRSILIQFQYLVHLSLVLQSIESFISKQEKQHADDYPNQILNEQYNNWVFNCVVNFVFFVVLVFLFFSVSNEKHVSDAT